MLLRGVEDTELDVIVMEAAAVARQFEADAILAKSGERGVGKLLARMYAEGL